LTDRSLVNKLGAFFENLESVGIDMDESIYQSIEEETFDDFFAGLEQEMLSP
jgi:hypothetical protein